MMSDRLIMRFVGIAVVLLVAGLTHLIAVLILPSVATKDALTLLEPHGATNHLTILPASLPSDTLIPFRDPATLQGICYFDLTKSPVRIRTKVEEGRLLTLSFRTRDGRIFYAMTDRSALRDTIDIRLVTDAQLKDVEASDDEEAGLPAELRLKAPNRRGLIVVTALVARPSEAKDAEARLKAVTCAPEPLPTEPQG